MNLNAPVVGSHEVRMTIGDDEEEQVIAIDVHLGDDLAQLARWHGDRLSLLPSSVEALLAMLVEQTPEHISPRWLKARARRDLVGMQKRGSSFDVDRECFLGRQSGSEGGCLVTVAFTTCKRWVGCMWGAGGGGEKEGKKEVERGRERKKERKKSTERPNSHRATPTGSTSFALLCAHSRKL